MLQGRFDLHAHSKLGKGLLAPRDLIALSIDRGLTGIALTDVHTVEGITEAASTASLLGVEMIPGIELITSFEGHNNIGVIGYFIDHTSTTLQQAIKQDNLTLAQAISTIKSSGGVAVLARLADRFSDNETDREVITKIVDHAVSLGIRGIEVDHPMHHSGGVEYLAGLANKYGLIQTAGSDNQFEDTSEKLVVDSRLGCRTVTASIIKQLKSGL